MVKSARHGRLYHSPGSGRFIVFFVPDVRQAQEPTCAHEVRDLLFHDLRRTNARNFGRAGVAEGIIRSNHEESAAGELPASSSSYAIVSRSDINDAILKLQEPEKRAEQDTVLAGEKNPARSTVSGFRNSLFRLAA